MERSTKTTCVRCQKAYDAAYVQACEGVPRCECGGVVKPDVVLYGEALDSAVIEGSLRAIAAADLLIVGGTSLTVYPAAGLIDAYTGHRLVLVNKTATARDARADLVLREPIGALFSRL